MVSKKKKKKHIKEYIIYYYNYKNAKHVKYKTSTIMLIIIVKFEMIITIIKALETE